MKKIFSIIAAFAVILSISSCGSETKKETEETKASGGKVTQTVFGGDSPEEEVDVPYLDLTENLEKIKNISMKISFPRETIFPLR